MCRQDPALNNLEGSIYYKAFQTFFLFNTVHLTTIYLHA